MGNLERRVSALETEAATVATAWVWRSWRETHEEAAARYRRDNPGFPSDGLLYVIGWSEAKDESDTAQS